MPRGYYYNITMTKPAIAKHLEKRKKKENRRSISETAEAILIESLQIPEKEL